ncbi:MAG: PPOX class F420-dependent oxidoreductase [bacterium]|nr:PPOX class F420-dependent oxidoreductase [bacterium]
MSESANLIPESHKDLLERAVVVTLVTMMPDGQPQATPVWCDYDGEYVRVNTARGRQKDKNMTARPKVTVLAVDPENPYRWLEVRGVVSDMDANQEVAVAHINKLSALYRGQPDYYARMPEKRGQEDRVMIRIKPTRVVVGG